MTGPSCTIIHPENLRQRLVAGVLPELVVAGKRGGYHIAYPNVQTEFCATLNKNPRPPQNMQVDGVFSAVPQVRLELTLDGF